MPARSGEIGWMIRTSAVALIVLVGLSARLGRAAGEDVAATPDSGAARTIRWIAVGGGPEPSSTEVSLEQDIALAKETFGEGGLVLFAGGRSAAGVRVLRPRKRRDVFAQVADLLDPKPGRDSTYRLPQVLVDGAATRDAVLDDLDEALREKGAPLLVYAATHGEKGETARDNGIALWGNSLLTVEDLAELVEAPGAGRPVRFVITACYSGGFADLAFAAGDAGHGEPALTPRCGLFASEWDETSSGCDPNPNRRAQEGYGIHFLNALRGHDRSGHPLDAANVDFDGDGRISLLEAHTRARIASRSMGVPTTTSERWLRHAAPQEGPRARFPLPEEKAVIDSLSGRLRLGTEAAARRRLAKLEKKIAEIDERLAILEDEEADRYDRLRIYMLGRWPTLDDPWHPAFPLTFRTNHRAIRRVITRSTLAADYRQAHLEANHFGVHLDRLRWRATDVRRLVRAYETQELASRLNAAGGPAWDYYERLLACERGGL
jgi:hypothetical protein